MSVDMQEAEAEGEDRPISSMDDSMLEKVKNIIEFHYDLELLQKRQELEFLKCEIARGENILNELKQLLYYDNLIHTGMPPTTLSIYTGAATLEDYSALLEDSPSPSLLSSMTPSPSQTHLKKMEHKVQYEMKSDGTFVKLVCPICGKDKYGNILGLSNHCRIMHDLRFVTPEERIEKCGIPVSLEEIPSNYFVENEKIIHSEINLAQIRSAGSFSGIRRIESERHGSAMAMKQDAASSYMSNISNLSESRFYTRKRIVIGNLSKRIIQGDEKMSKANSKFTHKWKMYLHGPPEDFAVESFIKKVRFFLHPSYHPNDVIDVVGPPFTLSNYAWGEFPIRLQVYFWDPKNPPKEFVHQIKFKKAKYTSYTKSEETEYWIDLDKHTEFRLDLPIIDPKSRKIVGGKDANEDNAPLETETVHQDGEQKKVEQELTTLQSDSEEAVQMLQNKKRSFSPSLSSPCLDLAKKRSALVAHMPPEPLIDNSTLYSDTSVVESSILTAPVPLHPRLSASSLISPISSKSLDRSSEMASMFTTPSRPESPLTLSSVLATFQSPPLQAKVSSTLPKSVVSSEIHPVKESHFRDMMETAIPYYPLVQNDFVTGLLSDKINDFYAYYPAQSYELAQSLDAFMQWKPCKQKSVEWHRAKLISLFCQMFFKLERPLSTKRIVCWCRDHGYAPLEGNMHIQVPPTPQQVIRPIAEPAVDLSDDDPDLEKVTCMVKGSFSSEKELITSLEPMNLELSRNESDGYCRYCGKPLVEPGMTSHYKRCPLKPIRMQLANLPTAVASKAKALPPCTRENQELWLSKAYRSNRLQSLVMIDPSWIWESLLPLRLPCVPTHPKELLAHSVAQCRYATRLAPTQQLKCLTPVHIYMARTSAAEYFDFLFKE